MIRKDSHKYQFCVLLAFAGGLVSLVSSAAHAQSAGSPTPAGTVISTVVSAAYQTNLNGPTQIITSNIASVLVTASVTVPVTPPHSSPVPITPAPVTPPVTAPVAPPDTKPVTPAPVAKPVTPAPVAKPVTPAPVAATFGVSLTARINSQIVRRPAKTVFPVTIHNTGSGTDSFTFTVKQSQHWSVALIIDAYGDGLLHPGENTAAPAKITLRPGQSQSLLVVMVPPVLLPVPTAEMVVLSAVSGANPAKSAQVTLTTISGAGYYTGQ